MNYPGLWEYKFLFRTRKHSDNTIRPVIIRCFSWWCNVRIFFFFVIISCLVRLIGSSAKPYFTATWKTSLHTLSTITNVKDLWCIGRDTLSQWWRLYLRMSWIKICTYSTHPIWNYICLILRRQQSMITCELYTSNSYTEFSNTPRTE